MTSALLARFVSPGKRWIVAGLLCLGGVAALLWPLSPPGKLGWRPLLQDWCHVPVFAVMTAALLMARWTCARPFLPAALGTFSLMTALAVGTELLQALTGRSPDFDDLLLDLVGIAIGITVVGIFAVRRMGLRVGFAGLTAALVLFSSYDLLKHAAAVRSMANSYPVIEDFENSTTWELWTHGSDGKEQALRFLRSKLSTGAALLMDVDHDGLTSLHFDSCGQDWSRAGSLIFECDSSLKMPVRLGIRMDHAGEPSQRVRLETTLPPGPVEIRVPLPKTAAARDVLRSVGQLVLFTDSPGVSGLLTLDNLRLSPEP